jgi:hypothetical protein
MGQINSATIVKMKDRRGPKKIGSGKSVAPFKKLVSLSYPCGINKSGRKTRKINNAASVYRTEE